MKLVKSAWLIWTISSKISFFQPTYNDPLLNFESRDIVDTRRSDGNVYSMFIGSLSRHVDEHVDSPPGIEPGWVNQANSSLIL